MLVRSRLCLDPHQVGVLLEISGLMLQAGYSESLAMGSLLGRPASHTALYPRTLWPLFPVVCSPLILTWWTLEDRQLCLRLLSGSPQAPDETPAALGQLLWPRHPLDPQSAYSVLTRLCSSEIQGQISSN